MSKGFGNLMRQAQVMQKKMEKLQTELDNKTVEGSAGQGKIKCTATGAMKIGSVTIDPALLDPEESDLLEDLLIVAVNDALDKAQEMKKTEMDALTGGMSMPGMF